MTARPLHLLVTGATGYLGSRFCQVAEAAGHRLTILSRDQMSSPRRVSWTLGTEPPAQAFTAEPVDAVVHLAHQWDPTPAGIHRNIDGSRLVLEAARRQRVPRFVFCSSISADAQAANQYGRTKFAIEQLLDRPGEVSARVGVIYGGPEQAMWGTLCRLARLPVLPMIRPDNPVQPIHIDEVCRGLLALAALDRPQRRVHGLGAAHPMAFGQFLKLIAKVRFGRSLPILPLPLAPILALVTVLEMVPGMPKTIKERVLGLAGARSYESASDLAALGLTLADPSEALALP